MNMSVGLRIFPQFRRWTIAAMLVSIAVMLVGSFVLDAWPESVASARHNPFSHVAPSTAEKIAFWEEQERIVQGGRFYKRLKILVDYPGVQQPKLLDAICVDLPDATEVVGINVSGEACAFVQSAMLLPQKHIVNLTFNGIPISVTYCDLVDCVRVLKDDTKSPIDLHVGGLDIDNQMVFLLNGKRYGQESTDLPLQDLPFTRTTLGEWKQTHPCTRVYVGTTTSPAMNET